MKEAILKGKVTFINHEKKYAIIEYEQNGKKKTVNGNIDEKEQKKLKEQHLIKKTHHFLIGDIVTLRIRISDRGDRMIATNIEFLYNHALDELINKSRSNNTFTGYLKNVDGKYFVKEIESYLFFPVPFSIWQIKPTEEELNEPVIFSLDNLDKKDKIIASLLNNVYIPEFHTAVKLFKNKIPVDAEVFNITPHGIYLNVIGNKIQAKLSSDTNEEIKTLASTLKAGDKLKVIISHLSKSRIAVTVNS
jgi:hypothetical protein